LDNPEQKANSPKQKRTKRALGQGLSALLEGSDERSIMHISIDKISPSPDQPRTLFPEESLHGLAASIKTQGLLQPLIVQRTLTGYELVAGERRLRAAKMAGFTSVPCIVSERDERGRIAASLIENLQREDLNPIELAIGIHTMQVRLKITQAEIAEELGMSRSNVANTLRLLDLPDKVRELVLNETLPAGAARALLSLPDGLIAQTALQVVNDGFSVRQVEVLVRKILDRADKQASSKTEDVRNADLESKKNPYYDAIAEELTKYFGTRTVLKQMKEGGTIVLRFYSDEDLERLLDIIGVGENPL